MRGDRKRRLGAGMVPALLAFAQVAAAATSVPAAAPAAPIVRYEDGRLSIEATDVPLPDLIAAIGRETGVWVEGEAERTDAVTTRFTQLALDQALERLLDGRSFVITYRDDGTPRRVELFGKGTAPPPPPPTPKAPALLQAIAASPPVALPPQLASRFPVGRARLVPVLAHGRNHADPSVRQAAWGVFAQAVGSDSTLRRSVLAAPAENLARLARAFAGPRAAEMLDKVAASCPDPLVRAKAMDARRRLDAGAG